MPPAPAPALSTERLLTRHALRLGAMLLGAYAATRDIVFVKSSLQEIGPCPC
jgi:hypothetical protein